MTIDEQQTNEPTKTKEIEHKALPFPRYFAMVTALPLLMLILLFSSCLANQRSVIDVYSQTAEYKTKSEELKKQISVLEASNKSAQDAMLKVRNQLSLKESVEQSWAVQKVEQSNKPMLDSLTNQHLAAKRQWDNSAKKLGFLLLLRSGFIIAVSMLFAWVCLSIIMYISLRDYKPALLVTLGCGVSVLALIVVQLYPVLFGFVTLR